jgi:enoyl-CoA hydratase/carnithine racemase
VRKDVRIELSDRVAVLTVDRPHARNAIAVSTMDELDGALDQIEDSDASVLVVTGGGDRAFVSGGDLKDLDRLRTLGEAEAMAVRMRCVLDRLVSLPMPVVAALNGHALGGGAEVAVAADIRVAADDVRIGFTQSTLGIMPAWGGVERLADLIGRSRAMLLLTSGRAVDAARGYEIGLVDEVVERTRFEEGWRSLAASIPDVTQFVPSPSCGSPRITGALRRRRTPAAACGVSPRRCDQYLRDGRLRWPSHHPAPRWRSTGKSGSTTTGSETTD